MSSELQDDDLMEGSDDSDDVPSGLDDLSDDEEGSNSGDKEDEDEAEPSDNDEDGDAFSLAEGSDAEDLLPLDADVPMGLIDYDGSDAGSGSDAEEWGGISSEPQQKNGEGEGKRKRVEEGGGRRAQRKKLRALPTFASYEDYAKLIEDGPEDNI